MAKIIGAEPLYDYETKVWTPSLKQPSIVVVGGGHGQSAALRGLKRYSERLTGIVAVSDDGGGSGMLRSDLGILPPGDIRNCIMALSDTEPILEQMMNYRFNSGSLTNQSFGNLFLAAMYGISNSFDEAVARMCEILGTHGRVLPVTNENIDLEARFENGNRILGESRVYLEKKLNNCRIQSVRLVPEHPKALPNAVDAIMEADMIIYGPGSLYTSVIPNFLVDGISEAVKASSAKRIFVMNVMTQDGETEGYSGADHIRAFLEHAGDNTIDICLANSTEISEELRLRYKKENSEPVNLLAEEIEKMGIRVVTAPLAGQDGYARHNSDLLASAIMDLWNGDKQIGV